MFRLMILSFLFLISCKSAHDSQEAHNLEVIEIAQDQQIPKALMSELDNELKEDFKSAPPLYSFLPLTVQFDEGQTGVLTKPRVQVVFPKGGGAVDLKDVVAGDGSFFMSFPEEQFDKESDLLHIYYASNSPKVKINNEIFGLGCGNWTDIKSSFSKIKKQDFLKVNTHELRYLYVLAGTYVFIFRQGRNIYLSQLTVTDSRHSDQLCLSGGTNG